METKFKQGDEIIAIKDSIINVNGKNTYKIGDKFKVYRESIEDSSGLRLIIMHPELGEIEVKKENFKLG